MSTSALRDAVAASSESAPVASARNPVFPVRIAAVGVVLVALFGLFARLNLIVDKLHVPRRPSGNIFYHLYVRNEAPFLWLLAGFGVAAWWLGTSPPGVLLRRGVSARLDTVQRALVRAPAWGIATAVFGITAAGTWLVMHGFGLSMDEHAITFQSRLLLAGKLTAPIPAEWQPLARWLTPIFVNYQPVEQRWVAAYFPGYAAIRSLFAWVGLGSLTNPALAAASMLLLHAVARRLWPGAEHRRTLALLLLGSSAQFLVMSMSGYSMPAYLALNLLWLLLYLRGDPRSWAALPWVGMLALGLHNPFPHALFVVPFLVRALRERRWRWLAYWGVVYAAAAVLWLGWLRLGAGTPVPGSPPSPGLLANFAFPSAHMRFVQGMNLSLLFTWQTPALALLLLVALLSWRSLGRDERDLAAGLLVTFGFYFLYRFDQGHGWGYRYIYGVLGNVALLGAAGAAIIRHRWPAERRPVLSVLVAASLAATVLVQWPLRAWRTERFVAPYARTMELIETLPVPLVAVDITAGWYATDLVRNDPLFERRPKVFLFVPGYGPHPSLLPAALRDSVYLLSRADMARLGMPVFPPPSP